MTVHARASSRWRPRMGSAVAIALMATAAAAVGASPAKGSTWWGDQMTYDKNGCVAIYSCNPDPTLTFTYGDDTGCCMAYTWRSSSGNSNGSTRVGDQADPTFGKKGKNPCYEGVGWIPDSSGTNPLHSQSFSNSYKIRDFPDHDETLKGFVFFIFQGQFSWQDGAECGDNDSDPTDRTELFIHSEMTLDHGQNPNVEIQEWTTSSPDYDYASNGCVKVEYKDMVEEAFTTDSTTVEWRWKNRHDGTDVWFRVIDGW